MLKQRLIQIALVLGMWTMSFSSYAIDYRPYDGSVGYQEIQVADNLFYVGFHAGANESPIALLIAWNARSAQLCKSLGASQYAELNHVLEPVTEVEKSRLLSSESLPEFRYVHGVHMVYIYIYRSGGGGYGKSVNAQYPSKLAAVRCVHENESLLDPNRAMSVDEALKSAQEVGILGTK